MKCNDFFTYLTYLYDYKYFMGINVYNLNMTYHKKTIMA